MSEKKFSKKHEWVSLEGDTATVGITKHATELLGDIVFAEVPDVGKTIEKEGQAAVVESTKAASDVYSPISGEITEGNKSIVAVVFCFFLFFCSFIFPTSQMLYWTLKFPKYFHDTDLLSLNLNTLFLVLISTSLIIWRTVLHNGS